MDTVGGYAFDHYHGWKSGRNFSLGLGSGSGSGLDSGLGLTSNGAELSDGADGVPSTIAVSQVKLITAPLPPHTLPLTPISPLLPHHHHSPPFFQLPSTSTVAADRIVYTPPPPLS